MALINRVSRLFRADLHAVLDRIEEPDVLLRQAVREMEEELARDERRIKLLHQERTQLESRVQESTQSLQEIEQQLDVCFAAHNDDLARTLIRRRLETQRFQTHLERKHTTLQDTLAGLGSRVDEQRTQLDSMRQKVELLAEETSCDGFEEGGGPDFSVRDEDVEVALLREKQRRNRT